MAEQLRFDDIINNLTSKNMDLEEQIKYIILFLIFLIYLFTLCEIFRTFSTNPKPIVYLFEILKD